MKFSPTLSVAVTLVLSGFAAQDIARAGDDANSLQLQEIIVTAQRRSENLQSVPISIQAMTSETLKQLNVATFDD